MKPEGPDRLLDEIRHETPNLTGKSDLENEEIDNFKDFTEQYGYVTSPDEPKPIQQADNYYQPQKHIDDDDVENHADEMSTSIQGKTAKRTSCPYDNPDLIPDLVDDLHSEENDPNAGNSGQFSNVEIKFVHCAAKSYPRQKLNTWQTVSRQNVDILTGNF